MYSCSLQMQKCIQLDEKLKEMDREIAVNPQFVQKVTHIFLCNVINHDKFEGGWYTNILQFFTIYQFHRHLKIGLYYQFMGSNIRVLETFQLSWLIFLLTWYICSSVNYRFYLNTFSMWFKSDFQISDSHQKGHQERFSYFQNVFRGFYIDICWVLCLNSPSPARPNFKYLISKFHIL